MNMNVVHVFMNSARAPCTLVQLRMGGEETLSVHPRVLAYILPSCINHPAPSPFTGPTDTSSKHGWMDGWMSFDVWG